MTRLTSTVAFLACLALACAPASARSGRQSESTAHLYAVALEATLKQMAQEWGAIDDSDRGERIRTDYRNVVVMKDRFTPDGLPLRVGSAHVEYLDHDGLVQRAKQLRKPFAILEGAPIAVDGSALVVTYRVLWVTVSKGMLSLALSDFGSVYFRYDCDAGRFLVERVQLGGI